MANAPCPSVTEWPSAAQHCVYEWLLAPHPYCLWLAASGCNCTEQMLAVQAGLLMMPPSACWQTLPETLWAQACTLSRLRRAPVWLSLDEVGTSCHSAGWQAGPKLAPSTSSW